MNSQCFIRDARALMSKMASVQQLPEGDTRDAKRRQCQQDLDYLCNNMTNPSLPTAYKLVISSHRQKYHVDSKTFHRVNQFA